MFKHYIKSGEERLEHLAKYKYFAKKVKEIITKDYKNVRIYVFGSILKGRFTALSDIDLLIVFDKIDADEAATLKANILKSVGLSVPLQLHVATTKEFKEWYLKFVDEVEEI